ncbi:MAG: hypothetical protein RMK81_14300 [Geminicoccaceae bacterium]|nr:hypothetical protein [Geminicoccaceae bacterium]
MALDVELDEGRSEIEIVEADDLAGEGLEPEMLRPEAVEPLGVEPTRSRAGIERGETVEWPVAIDGKPEREVGARLAEPQRPDFGSGLVTIAALERRRQPRVRLEGENAGADREAEERVDDETAIGTDVEKEIARRESQLADSEKIRVDRRSDPTLPKPLDIIPALLQGRHKNLHRPR